MAPKWSPKDPNDIRDYWFDWGSDALAVADRFLPAGVTITDSEITVADGVTKVTDDFDDKRARFRVSGGTVGAYEITNLVTVSTGEQFEDTKTLTVKERTT